MANNTDESSPATGDDWATGLANAMAARGRINRAIIADLLEAAGDSAAADAYRTPLH